MKPEQPDEIAKTFIVAVSKDLSNRCMAHVEVCIKAGLPIQMSYSLVGSAVATTMCGGMRAMADTLKIPYTEADHQAYIAKVQAVLEAEDNRLRQLASGEHN